jgi:DNA-binding winged helix-turn-helix (wHTH) protein
MKMAGFTTEEADSVSSVTNSVTNGIAAYEQAPEPKSYTFGPFHFNVAERLLLKNGELIHVPPKEMQVLLALLRRRGHLVDKQAFLEEVWPGSFVEEGNLARHVSFLRQRLANHARGTTFIETVPRRGYRFVDPPSSAPPTMPTNGDVRPRSESSADMVQFQIGTTFAAKPAVEFAIEIKAPIEAVWQMFATIERWPEWASIIREIHWEATPSWEPGSAFVSQLNGPYPMHLRHVVMDCVPKRRVGCLVYGAGPVIERWIFFQSMQRKTLVRTIATPVGPASEPLAAETSETIQQCTVSLYSSLRSECERLYQVD